MKSAIKKNAIDILGTAKLRQTASRIAILRVLLMAVRPVTAEHIAEKLGPKSPNKVTIYRVLESLLQADIVHKAYLKERTWHFELSHNCTKKQCHPHFTCTNCGQTHCLTNTSVPMAKSPDKGFVIHHQRVQLEGLCPDCNEKKI